MSDSFNGQSVPRPRLWPSLGSKGAGARAREPEHRPRPAVGGDLSLDEEVEVGARELVVDALQQRVGVGGGLRGARGAGPRAVLRGVGEGEGAGVEEAVGAHQAHGHSDGCAQPAPVAAEGGYVGHNAHQGPRAPGGGTEVKASGIPMTRTPVLRGPREAPAVPVHGFRLHVPEPDLEPRVEVLTVEFQRGHVAPTAQLGEEGSGVRWPRACCSPSPAPPPHPESDPRPPTAASAQSHLQGAEEGHRSDRLPRPRHAGAEGELHRLGADDGPARAVVEQRPVCLLGAGGGLRGDEGMVVTRIGGASIVPEPLHSGVQS